MLFRSRLLHSEESVNQRVIEFASHQGVLRAFGRSGQESSDLNTALSTQQSATLRVLGWAIPGQVVFSIVYQISMFVLAVVTVSQWASGVLTVPEVIAIFVVVVRFLEPFQELADLSPAMDTLSKIIDRTNMIVDAPILPVALNPVTSQQLSLSLGEHPDAIEFRDVHFSYARDELSGTPATTAGHLTLDGVSFSVPRGSTTAIVGPSGSGKSTQIGRAHV